VLTAAKGKGTFRKRKSPIDLDQADVHRRHDRRLLRLRIARAVRAVTGRHWRASSLLSEHALRRGVSRTADYRESAALKFVGDRDLIQTENRLAGQVENIQKFAASLSGSISCC
jgi:hypothetical protein